MHERLSGLPPPIEHARGGNAVMAIQRMITHGASWPVALDHLPALLDVVDEQEIPLDICLDQGTGCVSLHAASVRCRRRDGSLFVDGPDSSLCIDLELLAGARAVSRVSGCARRLSLELVGRGSHTLLTITGPELGNGHAGDVWQLLMEAMLPGPPKARRDAALPMTL
jgi:hypothetical protein